MKINALTSLALAISIGFLGWFQVTSSMDNITTVESHIKELRKSVIDHYLLIYINRYCRIHFRKEVLGAILQKFSGMNTKIGGYQ